jgi:hypothetical protein
VGFEPAFPASEWPKTHAVDSAATGIGLSGISRHKIQFGLNFAASLCDNSGIFVRQPFTKDGLGMRIYNVQKSNIRRSKPAWSLFEGISACNVPNHPNLSKCLQSSDCTYDTFCSLLPTIKPFENTPSGVRQPPSPTLYKTISLHHCALWRWSQYEIRRGYKLLCVYVCFCMSFG